MLGKRTDGFHEIETLMVPVSLCDTLAFQATPESAIDCACRWHYPRAPRGEPARAIPQLGENNLAVRTARLLREAAGVNAGAHIELIKRVPLEAGLAGGSSDAAAALVAANVGWGLNWPVERLGEVASQLGSDVAFFLAGGVALCTGRGENVSPEPHLAPLHFVIVQPPAGLSTAEVYKHCRPAAQPCRARRWSRLGTWQRGRGRPTPAQSTRTRRGRHFAVDRAVAR